MDPDKPLNTFYTLFKPGKIPGSGDFLASNLGTTTEGPLVTSDDDRAVHIFTTKARAEEFLLNNPKCRSYEIFPLSEKNCRTMLLEGKEVGLHQQVAFNAGAGTSKVFPIEGPRL